MKVFTKVLWVIVLALLSASCTKKDGAKTTSSHFLSASVSGSPGSFFAGDGFVKTNKNAGSPYPYVEINGTLSSGEAITVWIYSYTGSTGTFTMDGVNYGGMHKSATALVGVASSSGSLTVTSSTPNIVGSFNFTCTDLTVVSGTFNSTAP